ncbi:hypothetical protein K0M31_007341 [Melipona bicolor]|uniref:Uncharacterized protein n=1 Tax=Melipona bicolor TaxID=60889 RepID=A0AA40GB82_9HYME|nr:hypothetical protein K0M31_007341 [Melipona bicolor]
MGTQRTPGIKLIPRNGLQAENGPQLTQAKILVLSRHVEAKSARVAEGSPTSASPKFVRRIPRRYTTFGILCALPSYHG